MSAPTPPPADSPPDAVAAALPQKPKERPARLSQSFDVLFRPQLPQDIPNLLTVIRLGLTTLILPPLTAVFVFLGDGWAIWAVLILAVLLSLTDWADGYLARKYHWTSAFGAWLDPMSDKIYTLVCWGILIALTIFAGMNWWLMALIVAATLAREHYINRLRAKFIFSANIWGKVKTTLQMLAIVAFLAVFIPEFTAARPYLEPIAWGLLIAQLVMAWYSAIVYRLNVKGYKPTHGQPV